MAKPDSSKATRITTAGGDSTFSGNLRIHGYSMVTDGANSATLKIYSDSGKTAQIWEDKCIGPDGSKTTHFAAPLDNKSGTTVFEPNGTGGVFYVRTSRGANE